LTAEPRHPSADDPNGPVPSRRRLRVLTLAAAALAALCLLASQAFASKEAVDYFGGNGTLGGQFGDSQHKSIGDVAVNSTGAGPAGQGDIYVADPDNNRIQRFDSAGDFISAWGADVVSAGGTGDVGDAEERAFEVCTVASQCKAGVASGGNGAQTGNGSLDNPYGVAVDEDTGDVYVSDRGNYRIDVYDGAGDFLYAIGRDVAEPDGGTALEVCHEATDVCRAGDTGSGPGEIGSGLAVALTPPDGNPATGTIFLADTGNRRVDTYGLDGTSPGSFGSSAVFEASTPTQVAVDSRGIVYASNSRLGGEIERYDSENADGGGVGFLAPIPATVSAVNEVQKVLLNDAFVGAIFTLTCPDASTTDPITLAADSATTSANIKAALESKCGASFSVSAYYPYGYKPPNQLQAEITFEGGFAQTDVPQMTCAVVSGAGTCEVRTVEDGHPAVSGPLPSSFGSQSVGTLGLEVASGGSLYALRERSGFPTRQSPRVYQFGPLNDPGLSAAPGAADDVHGAAAEFGYGLAGLGLDDSTGRLFVPYGTTELTGVAGADVVYVLDSPPPPPPTVTLDPIASPGARSAGFGGTVDANGAPTTYRFEYVDDARFAAEGFAGAEQAPLSAADAGKGEDPAAVAATVHGLQPSTTYHVRLLARQTLVHAEAESAARTFTTAPAPPTIAAAATASSESATLRGSIDPEGEAVSEYRFQWGTDTSYGHTTPAGSLPSGNEPAAVSAGLTGLAPGATYHYRLQATNGTGTTTGPDRAFTTPAGPPRFPARAYELAGPYPTGGIPMVTGTNQLSEDGDRVLFANTQPLAGSTLRPPPDQVHNSESSWHYIAERGPEGWQTRETGLAGGAGSATMASADGRRVLTESAGYGDPRFDPEDQNGEHGLDVYQRRTDGKLVWISRDPRIAPGTPQTAPGDADAAAHLAESSMSADGHTVVFRSQRRLLDADTTPQSGPSAPYRLYKWTEGSLGFIGIRPDGSVPAAGSLLGSTLAYGGAPYHLHAVSPDGHRVVWSAARTDGGARTLYMQRDGAPTVEVSKAEGVPPLPSGQPYDVTYRGAAKDDSRVFFTSASRLTPDSGAAYASGSNHQDDLYVYDLATEKVRDLTPRLDGIEDPSVDPTVADRARVLGVASVSEDGRDVYFVADAAYPTAPNPEGDLPSPAGRNLYMARLGEDVSGPVGLRFVAALGAGDEAVWQRGMSDKSAFAGGAVLGFGSGEDLTGAAGEHTGGSEQLFVYDAGADTLECASCPADGSLPASAVNGVPDIGNPEEKEALWQPRNSVRHWVSEEGAVFFQTATPLVAGDRNNVEDVYEYRSGQLRLITPGTGTGDSYFEDASRDGSTVLFVSPAALVPRDREPGVQKLYAARVGGGFPYALPRPPCDVSAGACEGAGTSAPQRTGAGTAAFSGPGNPASAPEKGRCARLSRTVRRLAHRARRLRRAARRSHDRGRARRLRRGARRHARAAHRRSAAAKRCRRRARAGAGGRAGR